MIGTMNRITIVLLLMTFVLCQGMAMVHEEGQVNQDTIMIKFGKNSQIVILVEDEKDLKTLQNYDVNGMLSDLQISIDSMSDDEKYLKIEDESGIKYLKDTTVVIEPEKDEEMVEEEEDWSDYQWDDRDDDSRDEKYKKDFSRKTKTYGNFEFGMNNYLSDGGFPDETNELYTVKPWGSWYVALSSTNRSPIGGPLYLDWGAMIDFYNFKYQNVDVVMDKDDDGVIFLDNPYDRSGIKSKLTSIYINATFVPMLHFGKSGVKKDVFHWGKNSDAFRIGFGGYAGYRICTYAKNVYQDGNSNRKRNHQYDNFYVNNFRYGMRFQFGFNDFDFFFNYDVSPLYVEGKGPELHPISFGVIL